MGIVKEKAKRSLNISTLKPGIYKIVYVGNPFLNIVFGVIIIDAINSSIFLIRNDCFMYNKSKETGFSNTPEHRVHHFIVSFIFLDDLNW